MISPIVLLANKCPENHNPMCKPRKLFTIDLFPSFQSLKRQMGKRQTSLPENKYCATKKLNIHVNPLDTLVTTFKKHFFLEITLVSLRDEEVDDDKSSALPSGRFDAKFTL
jgi:hypothetical protein